MIDNWISGYVKLFETVCWCIEETLVAIKDDRILDYSFYDRQLLIDDLTALSKADQKARTELAGQTIYLLDKCIQTNKDSYLEGLYVAIYEILNSDEVVSDDQFLPITEELNKLVGALASELLNEHFSISHLYRESFDLKEHLDTFSTKFVDFHQRHHHQVPLNEYDVVLKMNGGRNNRLLLLDGFSDDFPEQLVPDDTKNEKINSFLASRGVLFYQARVKAHDSAMAISKAIEQMESVLDKAMLGFSILDVEIQRRALVVLHLLDTDVWLVRPVNGTDTSYADDERVVRNMIRKIDHIQENDSITDDVKDRLTSALRHLRIGNTDTDTGQQLVNYWVALEFIFSSPKAADSTITRLEKNLMNTLMCCYASYRVSYMNDILHKNGTLEIDLNWWSLNDEDLNNLISGQPSQLTRFHLQEMKASLLGNRDAVKQFFSNHRRNINWQIYRIYRYRNKLIHEAAILPGLETVIRCQRFFLVLLLNQLIGYFSESKGGTVSMDSFFFEYSHKYNMINSIIKQELEGKERVQKLMEIEVYNELIRQKV